MRDSKGFLDQSDFLAVIANAPLISIDLLISDEAGLQLVGLRRNKPARGFWFVLGGRILKNESIYNAFKRITNSELGVELPLELSSFYGVYEHFYEDNYIGIDSVGTHYVVLAYCLQVARRELDLNNDQHSRYRWLSEEQLLSDSSIHRYTQDYYRQGEHATSI